MSVANNGIKFYNAISPFFPKVLVKSEFVITQQWSFVSQFNVHSNVILFFVRFEVLMAVRTKTMVY